MSLHFIFRIRIKVGPCNRQGMGLFWHTWPGWNSWSCELEGLSSLFLQQRIPCQKSATRQWKGPTGRRAEQCLGAHGQPQAQGLVAAEQLLACFPFFPGKSAFSGSAELEISLILHIKGNPSYNRVSIVEGIKSKKSLMQQRMGAHSTAKGAASSTTGNRIYSVVKAGCQNPARLPPGEKRWARVRL